MTPLGNKQLGTLIANLRTSAKIYTQEVIPNKLIKDIFNEVVDELNSISGPKDKDFYRESITIPQATKLVIVGITDGAASYTFSTRRLIIPASGSNLTWTNDTAFSADWVGADVVFTNVKLGVTFRSTIESYVSGTTVVLTDTGTDSMPPANLANTELSDVTISRSTPLSNDIAIGALARFKYIDYITSIEDSLTDEVIPVDEKEFNQISKEGAYSAYQNAIVWTQVGDTLRFCKGSNVTTYGTRVMNIVRTPIPMTVNADYIDIRPANIPQVNQLVLYKVLKAKNIQDIPPDIQEAYSNLEKQKRAFLEEKMSEEKK